MMRKKSILWQLAPVAGALVLVGGAIAWYSFGGVSTTPEGGLDADQKMALAQRLLDENQPDKSLSVLKELADTSRRGLSEDGRWLEVQSLASAQDHAGAAEAASKFMTDFPGSSHKADAELVRLSAEVARAGLSNPALLKNVEEFVRANPGHSGAAKLEAALARNEIALGDTSAARRRLSSLVAGGKLDEDARAEIERELGKLNLAELMMGGGVGKPPQTYVVKSGDSIWTIARKYTATPELILRANNITDPKKLRVGQSLTIPDVEFSLVCDISRNTMTLFNHGEFVKAYTVRTGRKAGTTPTGEYKILNKKTDPTWRPGDGRVYLPGDPNNELGTRWMSFEGDILGIHGTVRPETVGSYASNGCIGLTKEDVEELFDLVSVGTSLKIIGDQNLERHKVIAAPELPPPVKAKELARQ